MCVLKKSLQVSFITASASAVLLLGGCGMMSKMGMGGHQSAGNTLSGAQEVPAVTTQATGHSTIKVASDRMVSGSVMVEGITPTAAHIHQAPAGVAGPVIIPLEKSSDKMFRVPSGTKLTDAQYAAYKKGDLYVNVHSAAHPGGEIRVQMKPE